MAKGNSIIGGLKKLSNLNTLFLNWYYSPAPKAALNFCSSSFDRDVRIIDASNLLSLSRALFSPLYINKKRADPPGLMVAPTSFINSSFIP